MAKQVALNPDPIGEERNVCLAQIEAPAERQVATWVRMTGRC